jgi:hypothetical protein
MPQGLTPAPASANTFDPHSALLRIGADRPSRSAQGPRGRMRQGGMRGCPTRTLRDERRNWNHRRRSSGIRTAETVGIAHR